jgi:hypothetical protein
MYVVPSNIGNQIRCRVPTQVHTGATYLTGRCKELLPRAHVTRNITGESRGKR